MPKIRYQGTHYDCTEHQSVLDVLLANQLAIPSSCRSGQCQTCLMQAISGKPPAAAQQGLKDTLKTQNYFLACSCIPQEDMEITLPDASDLRMKAIVKHIEKLSNEVVSICLQSDVPIAYRPGQFINLFRDENTARSYSLASLPDQDDCMQLHVRKVPGGRMTGWLHEEIACGTQVEISQAAGTCFYAPGNMEQPMLLIGTGTGLAPLYGIARDALSHGHKGEIRLFHGSMNRDGLYLHGALQALATEFANFRYFPCISNEAVNDPLITSGHVLDIAMQQHGNLSGWRVYLCGNPDMVKAARKKTFLGGAAMNDIYSDAFIPAQA